MIVVAALLMLGDVGCDGCTEAGCEDSLVIHLTDTEDLPFAEYSLTVVSKDTATTCVRFWGTPHALGAGGQGGDTGNSDWTPPDDCGDESSTFHLDYDDTYRPTKITMHEAGAMVAVEITSLGTTILSTTLTPTYEEYYPNGKRCDKNPCLIAEETLSLSASN